MSNPDFFVTCPHCGKGVSLPNYIGQGNGGGSYNRQCPICRKSITIVYRNGKLYQVK